MFYFIVATLDMLLSQILSMFGDGTFYCFLNLFLTLETE